MLNVGNFGYYVTTKTSRGQGGAYYIDLLTYFKHGSK